MIFVFFCCCFVCFLLLLFFFFFWGGGFLLYAIYGLEAHKYLLNKLLLQFLKYSYMDVCVCVYSMFMNLSLYANEVRPLDIFFFRLCFLIDALRCSATSACVTIKLSKKEKRARTSEVRIKRFEICGLS